MGGADWTRKDKEQPQIFGQVFIGGQDAAVIVLSEFPNTHFGVSFFHSVRLRASVCVCVMFPLLWQ